MFRYITFQKTKKLSSVSFSCINIINRYPPIYLNTVLNHMDNVLRKEKDYSIIRESIINDFIENKENCKVHHEANARFAKVLEHVVSFRLQYEGRAVIDSYKLLVPKEKLTPENIKLAYILSWCVALKVASWVITDDVIDSEITRFGRPCWHTLNNIGLSAVNDSLMIDTVVIDLFKKYFSKYDFYLPTLELFYSINFQLALGQSIDANSKLNGRPQFDLFTRERIDHLVKYKSTSVCYEFPLVLALYFSGKFDTQLYEEIASIVNQVGRLLLAQNDIKDTFAKPQIFGRESTDIQNGRCTWLAVEALTRGSCEQKKLFMEHYGVTRNSSEKIIKNLYNELQLLEVYKEFENDLIGSIYRRLHEISDYLPVELFKAMLSDVTLFKKEDYIGSM